MASASGSSLAKNAQCRNLSVTGDLQTRSVHSTEPICANVERSGNQNLTTGLKAVDWTTTTEYVAPTGGMSLGATGFTLPVSGYYKFFFRGYVDINGQIVTAISVDTALDGSYVTSETQHVDADSDGIFHLIHEGILYAEAGQLFNIYVNVTSGGTTLLTTGRVSLQIL